MIIAVDFDGTIVEHEYPAIGPDVPGAFDWLTQFQNAGARLILWTMRSEDTLRDAVLHCKARGIHFWGVNGNPEQNWSTSPKAYAQVYIDDAAAGCPLVRPSGRRPYVDWAAIGPLVLA